MDTKKVQPKKTYEKPKLLRQAALKDMTAIEKSPFD